MDHLMESYGKIWDSYLEDCRQALAEPIEVDRPIDIYYHCTEYLIKFLQDRKYHFTPDQIVKAAYHDVNKTGLYSLDLKYFQNKAATYQTWTNFKQIFTEDYH